MPARWPARGPWGNVAAMSDDTFSSPPKTRLHVAPDLSEGVGIPLDADRAHYLRHVLRLPPGARTAVFNGRDGEWAATVAYPGKRDAVLEVAGRRRPQGTGPDLWLLAAPIQRARFETVVEKATELGVARIVPVVTDRTQGGRVNTGRLAAIAVEAAEQCERLDVPTVDEPVELARLVRDWPEERALLVCAEAGPAEPIAAVAKDLAGRPAAVLVGPEGGFAQRELDLLRKLPSARPVGLGPRVLRADTAAVAALACWQSLAGDWTGGEGAGKGGPRPPFRA